MSRLLCIVNFVKIGKDIKSWIRGLVHLNLRVKWVELIRLKIIIRCCINIDLSVFYVDLWLNEHIK